MDDKEGRWKDRIRRWKPWQWGKYEAKKEGNAKGNGEGQRLRKLTNASNIYLKHTKIHVFTSMLNFSHFKTLKRIWNRF